MADLYDGTIKAGQHFFNAAGKPNWVIFDSATGAVQGTVVGAIKARATVQKQASDGGFGSVDALLIAASNGTGVTSAFRKFISVAPHVCVCVCVLNVACISNAPLDTSIML